MVFFITPIFMLFVITLLVVFFITPIFMLFVQFHGIFLKSSRGNQFYLGVPVLVNYLLKLTMKFAKKTSVDYDMKYMHRFMLLYFMFITLFHCTTNWSKSFASIYIIVQYVPKCSPVQNQGGMIFHH